MTRLYIPFYFEWAKLFSGLSDAEYGRLVKAILAFAMGKEYVPKLSREAKMAYRIITASIARAEEHRRVATPDKNEEKREKEPITFKRIERHRPTNTSIYADNRRTKPTIDILTTEEESKFPTNPHTTKNEELADAANEEKSAPTREQVRNFFKKQGFKSNPDEFFNFYESNGWKVGQNPMKNWYASAENWELRTIREETPTKTDNFPPRCGDFDVNEVFRLALERSYDGSDGDEDEE